MQADSMRDCITCDKSTQHYQNKCLECSEKHFFVLFHVPATWDEKDVLNTMIQDFYAMNSQVYNEGDMRAEILAGVDIS